MKKFVLMIIGCLSLAACGQAVISPDTAPENATEIKPVSGDAPSTPSVQPAQTSCRDEEFRQLDFWVGNWSLEWDQADGTKGKGTNIITKTPFGECVITENFDGAPTQQFKGLSVSTYHKPVGMWRQTWVDDQGGYFALSGGLQDDGTFKLDMTRLNEKAPYRRMIWKDIKADSLTWHWQGHSADETDWKDLWVIRYSRKPEL